MDDRYRCLCAGVLIHEVLGLEEAQIRHNEYGKPYSDSGPCFSASHSGKYTVLAVSSSPVGVDIEQTGQDNLELMPRIFTDHKILYTGNDLKRFYTLWTLKESLLKAVGTGLSLDMKELHVLPLLQGDPVSCLGQNWYGCTFPIGDEQYILSFVSQIRAVPEIFRFDSHFIARPWS